MFSIVGSHRGLLIRRDREIVGSTTAGIDNLVGCAFGVSNVLAGRNLGSPNTGHVCASAREPIRAGKIGGVNKRLRRWCCTNSRADSRRVENTRATVVVTREAWIDALCVGRKKPRSILPGYRAGDEDGRGDSRLLFPATPLSPDENKKETPCKPSLAYSLHCRCSYFKGRSEHCRRQHHAVSC